MPKNAIDRHLRMEIGGRIRALRTARGMKAQDLAAQLGISPQQLAKYQWGNDRLSAERIVRLAEIFGVTTDYLLRGESQDAA